MALQASLVHRYYFQPISFSYNVIRFGARRSWLLYRSARFLMFHTSDCFVDSKDSLK